MKVMSSYDCIMNGVRVMIDIHNHVLYGVDDGPETIEESVQILQDAKAQGIHTIICTPHYRYGMFPYPEESIAEHFLKLREASKAMGIRLELGCEYHVNSSMAEYFNEGRCCPLAGSRYLLAEYSFETEYSYIRESCTELLRNGYIPVIAHMERYRCFQKKPYLTSELSEFGVLLQVNADSVLGMDTRAVKKLCHILLKEECVDIIASDCHNNRERRCRMQECREYVSEKYGGDYAKLLFEDNPGIILKDASNERSDKEVEP